MMDVPRSNSPPAAPCFPPASPTAAKRKVEDSVTTESKSAKRQKTDPNQNTPRKLAKSPETAKSSTPANKLTPSSTSTTVATNSTQAQASVIVLGPTSSAVSNPSTPQLSTQQSSAAAPQVANTASVPTPFLAAPTYNPTTCFNRAVPSLITPWPHSFPAPTPRFTQPLPFCPVIWTNISSLKQEHIEAYELRAPWNPAPLTFEAVTQQAQRVKGKAPSEECVRKRFKKTCLAVFRHSGVYFEDTALGLEVYGVPKQKRLNELIETAKKTAVLDATTTNTAASTSFSTSTSAPKHKREDQPRVVRESSHHYEIAVYDGEVVAVQLQSDDDDDQPPIRVCSEDLIPTYNSLIDYDIAVTGQDEIHFQPCVPVLPFSPAAFDHWHSSVCFGRRHTFPRRITICKEIADGQYQLRDDGIRQIANIGLLFETYCLSQLMGTTDASDMIFDETMRKVSDTSFSGFLTKDLTLLQQHLSSGDPLLTAILDFLHQTVEACQNEDLSDSDDDVQVDDEDMPTAMDFTDAEMVCGMYHNHTENQLCYRHKAESYLLFPDHTDWKVPKENDDEQ